MPNFFKIIFLMLLSQSLHAQSENWRLSIGGGFPELAHIGAAYKLADQRLISLTLGTVGTTGPPNSKVNSLTVKHTFFLKSSNKFDYLKTWYFGQKMNYLKRPGNTRSDYALIGVDIGRQFNISKKMGVAFDVGVAYLLKQPDDIDPPFGAINSTPTVNFQLFRRF